MNTAAAHLKFRESSTSMYNNDVLELVSDGIVTADVHGKIDYMNASAQKLTGWNWSEVKGLHVEDVILAESLTTREKINNQTLLTGSDSEPFSKMTVSLRDRSGDTHTVEMRSLSVPGLDANQADSIYVFTDLSHYSSLKEELDFHSHYDQLTGLLNRKTFEKRVSLSIESAAQFNKQHVFCYLDINQFSAINDNCGTMAGDELLRRLAKRFQDVVRSGDTLARLGGDQFGILMEQCTTQQAERVIHKLITSIDTFRFKWDGGFHKVTAAIGICQIDKETGSLDTLMADSSNACFLAKESGANSYHVFNDNDTQLVAHRSDLVWLDKLNYALEEDGFSLYVQRIQPIPFGASSKSHFEVLIRMLDEEGGAISPGLFLPVAERYSLAASIDRWVIEHTLKWFSKNPKIRNSLENFSINLSGQSLSDETLLEFIIEQINRYDVPAESICFEITETATIENLTNAISIIEVLRRKGCRFALDDFGSGLSSFGYLKKLPVDYLKIDGQFVKDILDDVLDLAIVKSIAEIGQLMGMQTIAEFVESEEIKIKLESLGINYAQGFAVERPIPITALHASLSTL